MAAITDLDSEDSDTDIITVESYCTTFHLHCCHILYF